MGRVTNNQQTTAAPPPSSPLTHFTHPHALYPLSLYNPHTPCSGCKLRPSGTMYACTPCNFTLHQSCAALPRLITHPSHGGCALSLLTAASYPGGAFSCDACSCRGDGWSYHCSRCEYDLHVGCAAKPLRIRIQSHLSCELHLTFKSPYINSNGFSCDVCRKIGSNQWLYRCNSCEFDVHLDCTVSPGHPVLQHQHSLPLPPTAAVQHNHLMQSASTGSMNVHTPFQAPAVASTGGVMNPYNGVNGQFQGPVNTGPMYPGNQQTMMMQNNQAAMGGGLGSNLAMAAMQGFVEGAFQTVGQTVVQEAIGGGDGGGGDVSSF